MVTTEGEPRPPPQAQHSQETCGRGKGQRCWENAQAGRGRVGRALGQPSLHPIPFSARRRDSPWSGEGGAPPCPHTSRVGGAAPGGAGGWAPFSLGWVPQARQAPSRRPWVSALPPALPGTHSPRSPPWAQTPGPPAVLGTAHHTWTHSASGSGWQVGHPQGTRSEGVGNGEDRMGAGGGAPL